MYHLFEWRFCFLLVIVDEPPQLESLCCAKNDTYVMASEPNFNEMQTFKPIQRSSAASGFDLVPIIPPYRSVT
ncbi:hypothetical protein TNCV_1910331 [Trichonephila clavipes]|nr:hypothetical protein TNCV_1910331 [Trichonephila clavipes]